MAIHSGVKINVEKGAFLSLGSGYINNNCEIRCSSSITIGENVAISSEVIIRDNDAHQINESHQESPIVLDWNESNNFKRRDRRRRCSNCCWRCCYT